MLALLPSMASAESPPMLPAFFYGNVTLNNGSAPAGSEIMARIDGETGGRIMIKQPGIYGIENGDEKLAVLGNKSGKAVEFFLSIPGVPEIRSNVTSVWNSGTINRVGLSFFVDESLLNEAAPTESQSQSGSSGGGGGGGGSAGSAKSGSAATASFYYDAIDADRQITLSLTKLGLALMDLRLVLSTSAEKVNFEFRKVASVDGAPQLEDVYSYYQISSPKITDQAVKTGILRFYVDNAWLSANSYDADKVRLLRLNNSSWQALDTFHEGSDEKNHYYRASIPGFSYFAVISEKSAPQQASNNSEQLVEGSSARNRSNAAESNGTSTDSFIQVTGQLVKENTANPAVGMVIIAVIVIVGISLFLAKRGARRLNKRGAK